MSGPVSDRISALIAWDTSVSAVRLVTRERADALGRLGIQTVRDLLTHYPFRYLDLSEVKPLAEARVGEEVTVIGRVHDVRLKKPRPRLSIVEVAIVDGTGVLLGVWFNQPFMTSRFVEGENVAFAGTVELEYGLKQIKNPLVEKLGAESKPTSLGRILPIHRATEGLSTNWVRRLISNALADFGDVPDFMPSEIRVRLGLLSLGAALRAIHFPNDPESATNARRRLAFDELFVLQMGMAIRRHAITKERRGVKHITDGPAVAGLRRTLPFTLTSDQEKAAEEILADMACGDPMNRMLLGDVGTGKTAVAAFALCAAVDTDTQAAMMAPTEVLAHQYARKLGPVLEALGVPWTLLTGSTSAAERKAALCGLADGSIKVAFGTHALIEGDVKFARLTLAIVDEQHRFGVRQRLGLRAKGESADMLVMSATPIPRSLALTLYGDLAASYLRTRPIAGTTPPETRIIHRSKREQAYETVRRAVREGRQAYVVCALVDESDVTDARAAVREAERLKERVFADLKVGLLTGRMKSAEKVSVMEAFRSGDIDVLVTTTVVEVGVDVPNATVMIVEDADRFGLAQLHQLRGRVGRGEHPGEVLLFADPRTDEGRKRMDAIASTCDGFDLAERDLELRGEGELLGARQHGLPSLKLASLSEDTDLLQAAREEAARIIAEDPRLETPYHRPLKVELGKRFGEAWRWVSAG